jgi:CBS-domain-containing membrane protein
MKMNVEEVMSKDLIVGYVPGTVENALKILAEKDVSGIPVLKKGTDKLVGVVTRTDIFKNSDEDQLAVVMNEDFLFMKQDQDIVDAAKLLFEHRVHGLPVVNKKNKLVGIISPTEILKVLINRKIKCDVMEYISKLVVPVYVDTPINIIMEIIKVTNETALPVLDDNRKVVGIVTDGDLFKQSQIKEGISKSNFGMGADEDQWTWEGIRDNVQMYHATSEVSLPKIPVKEVMVKEVITTTKNTLVCDIAKIMIKNKISHVPIVDEDNRLVGMITDNDLMACVD